LIVKKLDDVHVSLNLKHVVNRENDFGISTFLSKIFVPYCINVW